MNPCCLEWIDKEREARNKEHLDTMKILASRELALSAIANVKVYKDTNFSELLALCVTIARIELEKEFKP